MSRKEVVRPGPVNALVAGQLTNRQVAAALRLSKCATVKPERSP